MNNNMNSSHSSIIQSITVLPYPQKLVNNILVPIIISCAQSFTKSLKESFSHQKQAES